MDKILSETDNCYCELRFVDYEERINGDTEKKVIKIEHFLKLNI